MPVSHHLVFFAMNEKHIRIVDILHINSIDEPVFQHFGSPDSQIVLDYFLETEERRDQDQRLYFPLIRKINSRATAYTSTENHDLADIEVHEMH